MRAYTFVPNVLLHLPASARAAAPFGVVGRVAVGLRSSVRRSGA